jgi:hypothetical protein
VVAIDDRLTITRNDQLMSAPVDDDLVFLNPATNSYVALDAIGRRIWDLLQQPSTLGDLISTVTATFDGDRGTIAEEVRAFVRELETEGMVRVETPAA